MAQKSFTGDPEPIAEEFNLQKLFVRILEKEDWTDKLASGLGKIRNKITRPRENTKSSKEARTGINRPHKVARLSKEPRAKSNRADWDPNLPKELRLLVPDMREVEKAYAEMTSGYKDFIRDVLKAKRQRQTRQRDTLPIVDSSESDH
jgi:hypothetical protein